MKILYLTYHGFHLANGVSKKMTYQIEALRSLGNDVSVCSYRVRDDGHRVREIDGEVISDFGVGRLAALRKRVSYGAVADYAARNKVELVYVRSYHNANPFTIRLFKQFRKAGARVLMEIPTYPYDHEYDLFSLRQRLIQLIDKAFRRKLAACCDRIVTFTNDKLIFGQKTICISNGISFDHVPLRHHRHVDGRLHVLAVAEVHYWHGFDRFVHGLGEYYKHGGKRDIVFDIVGGLWTDTLLGCEHCQGIQPLIDSYGIADHVMMHGALYGEKLDALFDIADFAIGSLGRHRNGIDSIKTLKNREYAARGVAFAYSEHDDDFDNRPYIYKVKADESPVDVNALLDFIDNNAFNPQEIRQSIASLSWQEQMKKCLFINS